MERHSAEYAPALRFRNAFEYSPPAATSLASHFQGNEWSYKLINEDANRLANHLIKKGIGTGMSVGVCLERLPGMVIALLAF